ncbi:MAG: UDP-N-acetylmuramoylalanyl-D-glutamyl-2,6-diaminopimelate--D-alanyl-D-alanine ligase [Roseiarcus sp.]|uniref:UDP-N-acetylmuramoylalanyl-D-glutamyl-2, 6-diaminopimelate--D-alanyl-D-alanine ligase n=1 Tax=Roseiarcus sp. TaxID=1969460 RepID=UPI003C51DEC7
MTALWSQAELTAAFGAAPTAPLGAPVSGVSIDSRTLEAGDLFIAIKGAAHDGHDHVARAFESGAAAAVVSRERAGRLAAFGPLFAVDDTLGAMERLGVAARARSNARIVVVTGSVGKTTVKEMLRAMLSACGATHASAHSYNNHWGVPLTLARMAVSARYGVLEIGMNHAGEIAPLTRMARPHAALVTTIAPVHIEYLGSIEAIADAKAEIFLGVEPGGAAALNRDAPQFERLAKAAVAHGARVLEFGRGADCDARLIEVEAIDGGSRVTARVLGRELSFVLGAPGVHMVENALGALLAAEALGANLDACASALERFSPQQGRGARFSITTPDGPAIIIDESYNANPASMRAALKLLAAAKPGPKGRRIAVIGDMLELGPKAKAMHAELAADLSASRVDLLFGAGPLTRALYDAAPASMRAAWAERSNELTDEVARALRGGDIAMVKGSNGSRMGPLVAALRDRFAHGAGG